LAAGTHTIEWEFVEKEEDFIKRTVSTVLKKLPKIIE